MATSPSPSSEIRLGSARDRAALDNCPKPYWELVQPGLYLGLYKGARTSSWYGRQFVGAGKYRQVRLGRTRDSDRRGAAGLSYDEALAALMQWHGRPANAGAGPSAAAGGAKGAGGSPAHPLAPSRLDKISSAWAAERPDIDFWLAGFFLRIEYAHVLHDRRVTDVSREAGVNVGELHVLLALRRNGAGSAMRPTELFRELLVTSGAVTKRLDSLKQSKLIERVAASDDRRSELVRLTAAGRRLADAAMTRISKSLASIVAASGVSTEELHAVDEVFRRLIAHM